ncbi:hypothetical protein WDW86_03990 [Bdellovibrionota bacterium FG-2]
MLILVYALMFSQVQLGWANSGGSKVHDRPVDVYCAERGVDKAHVELEEGLIGSEGLRVDFDYGLHVEVGSSYNKFAIYKLKNCAYAREFRGFLLEKQTRYRLSVPITKERTNSMLGDGTIMVVKSSALKVWDSQEKKNVDLQEFLTEHRNLRLDAEAILREKLNRQNISGQKSVSESAPSVSGQSSSIKVNAPISGSVGQGAEKGAAPAK